MVQIRTEKRTRFFSNNLFVSDCASTKKENDDFLGYKSNIEGEAIANITVCCLNIPMMSVGVRVHRVLLKDQTPSTTASHK